jgi:hypothetical protein
MSDTPRTDNQIGYDGSTMSAIRIEFCRKLERELNAVYDRIKRLEEAGDEAIYPFEYSTRVRIWTEAKEAKL